MQNMQYPVIIIHHKETGTFSIQSFDIPAGIAQGDTKEKAKSELIYALEDVLEFNHFAQGKPVPLPSVCEDISLGDIKEYCPWVKLDGEAKNYLDYVELPSDLSQKIVTHNRNLEDENCEDCNEPSLQEIYELINSDCIISVKYPIKLYTDGTIRMKIMPGKFVEDLIQFHLLNDGCGEISDELKKWIKVFQENLEREDAQFFA